MILIIGGTKDANALASLLKSNGYKVTLSTATEYGRSLAEEVGVEVLSGRMTVADMKQLFLSYRLIVDASHPYAVEVSQNAIKSCLQLNVPYVRYEREVTHIEKAKLFSDYSSLLEYLLQTEGKLLLTIGANNVSLFSQLSKRLVVKVLPLIDSLTKCSDADIAAHNIIAAKGRLSVETYSALLKEYDIRFLITKDSGEEGGVNEKIEACRRCNVQLLVLSRPEIGYPTKYSSIEELLLCIDEIYNK